MNKFEEILKYFPNNIYNILLYTLEQNTQIENTIQEIRIRVNRPILLKLSNADILIEYTVNQSEILQILEKLCNNYF